MFSCSEFWSVSRYKAATSNFQTQHLFVYFKENKSTTLFRTTILNYLLYKIFYNYATLLSPPNRFLILDDEDKIKVIFGLPFRYYML